MLFDYAQSTQWRHDLKWPTSRRMPSRRTIRVYDAFVWLLWRWRRWWWWWLLMQFATTHSTALFWFFRRLRCEGCTLALSLWATVPGRFSAAPLTPHRSKQLPAGCPPPLLSPFPWCFVCFFLLTTPPSPSNYSGTRIWQMNNITWKFKTTGFVGWIQYVIFESVGMVVWFFLKDFQPCMCAVRKCIVV